MRWGVVILIVLTATWLGTRCCDPPTRDTNEYNEVVPWFVWNYILPTIERLLLAIRSIEPPFFSSMRALGEMQVPYLLATVCEREIPELLDGGPLSVKELATKSRSDAGQLYRILRRLAQVGYFRELAPQSEDERQRPLIEHRFENTPQSDILRANHPSGSSVRWMLLHTVRDHSMTFHHLNELLDTPNVNLFSKVHNLQTDDIWEYFSTKHPERGEIFNKAMESKAFGSAAIAMDFPFSSHCKHLVDYAGGKGRMLYDILAEHDNIRSGVLFDLPNVIAEARLRWANDGYNVNVTKRVSFVSGSMFDGGHHLGPNDGGVTCYAMRAILHDWNDEVSSKILRQLRKRTRSQDKLLLLEMLPDVYLPRSEWIVPMVDITMAMFQGKERTPIEMNALLRDAGFGSLTITRTRSMMKVGVATPQ